MTQAKQDEIVQVIGDSQDGGQKTLKKALEQNYRYLSVGDAVTNLLASAITDIEGNDGRTPDGSRKDTGTEARDIYDHLEYAEKQIQAARRALADHFGI